ncbi:hypothetical protein BJV74DRAFT_161905 [Russula compacta]|nr:hypothetical protein BJV74DRAFT_161905 [Russula compacta]
MSPVSLHDLSVPLPSNLSKLNVTQLRAICKERRIVGYSKLAKAALLRKLGELSSLPPSSAQSTRPQAQVNPLLSSSGSSPSQVDNPLAQAVGMPCLLPHEPNAIPDAHILVVSNSATATSVSALRLPPCLSERPGKSPAPSVSALNASGLKRVCPEASQGQAHTKPAIAKKPKVAASSVPAANAAARFPNSERWLGDFGVSNPPVSTLPGSTLVPRIKEAGHQLGSRTHIVTTLTPGKRFKPLTITQPPSAALGTNGNGKAVQLSSSLPGDHDMPSGVTVQSTPLWHLDFPATPGPPLLSSIKIPPPLSQRKLIQRWAIILSGLSDEERFQCCLVSKLIRYAGKRRLPENVE